MTLPKKGGYSGGRPASAMGPPPNLPSANIRPRPLERSDGCTELTCPQHGERNSWHQEVVRLREQNREFARQAREGERLRVAVRQLADNASAGLIHQLGEWDAVVRASDLLDALNLGRQDT